MGKTVYMHVDGVLQEVFNSEAPVVDAPFVHQDSFKPGMVLRHPKTGELVDNHSRWNQINREHGLRCVGNDLMSKQPDRRPDFVTDSVILDGIERAESIYSDPSKFRARQNENMERLERYERLVHGKGR